MRRSRVVSEEEQAAQRSAAGKAHADKDVMRRQDRTLAQRARPSLGDLLRQGDALRSGESGRHGQQCTPFVRSKEAR